MAKTYYIYFGSNNDPRQFPGLSPTFLMFSNNGSAVTPPSISAVSGATGIYSFSWGTTTPIVFMADAATSSPGTVGRYVNGSLDPSDRADEYGNTMVALGQTTITQLTNTGTTLTAIGSTQFAFGQSTIAFGSTLFALSTNLGTTLTAIGNTGTALGQSSIAIGTSLSAIGLSAYANGLTTIADIVNLGSTLVGMGNSLAALGTSNIALGTTLYALIGTSADSFGSTSIDPASVFGFLKRAQEIAEGNQTYTKATGVLDLFARGGVTLLREKTISDTSSTTTKT